MTASECLLVGWVESSKPTGRSCGFRRLDPPYKSSDLDKSAEDVGQFHLFDRRTTQLRRRRQHRKHADGELAEVQDVDRAVVVVIEILQEAGLARVQAVARRKQAEVGDVHTAVTIGIAEVAEEVQDRVASLRAVVVAIEELAREIGDLAAQ